MNRRGKIRLRHEDLHTMLNLRENEKVLAMGTEFDPNVVSIVIESPHFDLVRDDQEAPIVHTTVAREMDPQGKAWVSVDIPRGEVTT